MLPALPPSSAYFSRNMLIAFCCCWPYEAPLPEDGMRIPIATSACAGTTAISVEATAAAPIIVLLVVMVHVLRDGMAEIVDVEATFSAAFRSIVDPALCLSAGSHPAPAGP